MRQFSENHVVSATEDLFNQHSSQGDECQQFSIWLNDQTWSQSPLLRDHVYKNGTDGSEDTMTLSWTVAPNLKKSPQGVLEISQWLLMSDHQSLISSSLPGCLCQIWSSTFTLRSQERDGRTTWKHDACGRVYRRRGGVKTRNTV